MSRKIEVSVGKKNIIILTNFNQIIGIFIEYLLNVIGFSLFQELLVIELAEVIVVFLVFKLLIEGASLDELVEEISEPVHRRVLETVKVVVLLVRGEHHPRSELNIIGVLCDELVDLFGSVRLQTEVGTADGEVAKD